MGSYRENGCHVEAEQSWFCLFGIFTSIEQIIFAVFHIRDCCSQLIPGVTPTP